MFRRTRVKVRVSLQKRTIQSIHTACFDSCLDYLPSGMFRIIITMIVDIITKIKWIFTLIDLLDIG
jgi:hypothetical protein